MKFLGIIQIWWEQLQTISLQRWWRVSSQTNELPHHCEIYKSKKWSYKDLPVRYAEFGTVYRYEQSGELRLTRVRGFTQDDAHIFVLRTTNDEFKSVIDLVLYVFTSLGFKILLLVSLRDKKMQKNI